MGSYLAGVAASRAQWRFGMAINLIELNQVGRIVPLTAVAGVVGAL